MTSLQTCWHWRRCADLLTQAPSGLICCNHTPSCASFLMFLPSVSTFTLCALLCRRPLDQQQQLLKHGTQMLC